MAGVGFRGITKSFGSVRVLDNVDLTLAMRPEALALGARPGRCELSGSVRGLEHLGADVLVHVEVGGAETPVVARAHGQPPGAARGRQWLRWPPPCTAAR